MTMEALPYGDPCPRCCAASTNTDECDRVCHCVRCPACSALCGIACAYCGASLGCRRHEISMEEHVATVCTATAERRSYVDAACEAGQPVELVRAQ
jgi:hypothetical protein